MKRNGKFETLYGSFLNRYHKILISNALFDFV